MSLEQYSSSLQKAITDYINGQGDIREVYTFFAIYGSKIGQLYKSKQLKREETIELIINYYLQVDAATKAVEQHRVADIMAYWGWEALTTDTSGGRSWQQLKDKPFTTGVASNCIAVAFCHPNVGMGAAHYNTIGEKVGRRFVEKLIDNQIGASPTYNELITVSDLKETMIRCFNESVLHFMQYTEKFPLKGTEILVSGVGQLDRLRLSSLTDITQNLAIKHPVMHDGRGTKQISMRSELGKQSGIVYGGEYTTPHFFNIS